jgi:hypothetical protein
MKLAALLVSLLLFVGCARTEQARVEEQTRAFERAAAVGFALCNRGKKQGILRNAVQYAKCMNAVEDRYLQPLHPYADLYAVRRAQRLMLAAKQDQKQLNEDDAQLEFAKFSAKIEAETDRRRTANHLASSGNELQ